MSNFTPKYVQQKSGCTLTHLTTHIWMEEVDEINSSSYGRDKFCHSESHRGTEMTGPLKIYRCFRLENVHRKNTHYEKLVTLFGEAINESLTWNNRGKLFGFITNFVEVPLRGGVQVDESEWSLWLHPAHFYVTFGIILKRHYFVCSWITTI